MEPVKVGAKFKSGTFGRMTALINPSENVNGAILRTGIFTGSNNGVVATGATAPTGYHEKAVIGLLNPQPMSLQYPVMIPAGDGVWVYPNGTATTHITYDLL